MMFVLFGVLFGQVILRDIFSYWTGRIWTGPVTGLFGFCNYVMATSGLWADLCSVMDKYAKKL